MKTYVQILSLLLLCFCCISAQAQNCTQLQNCAPGQACSQAESVQSFARTESGTVYHDNAYRGSGLLRSSNEVTYQSSSSRFADRALWRTPHNALLPGIRRGVCKGGRCR